MSLTLESQTELRHAAMAWLTVRTNDGADSIHSHDLLDFRFRGEPFRLMDPQAGIRKPVGWSAALSIRTVYRPDNRDRPYDDRIAADGSFRYKWRGLDPHHADNRALRAAMELQAPLIWFFGVGPALYQPVFPVYLVGEEPAQHQFVVAYDVARSLMTDLARGPASPESIAEQNLKRYIIREVRQRVHQPVFRATVMRAYETRCAVCALAHGELLDAAHIIPDRDDAGIPAVRNGLSLCKIHHAAFDAKILGIRPDYVIEVRTNLLDEVDGPMLKYGLQGCHRTKLRVVPGAKSERPDPDLLDRRFAEFRHVS